MKKASLPVIALLACLSHGAAAAVLCSLSASSIVDVYDPMSPVNTDNSGSVTLSCTRASSDPATVSFDINADYGMNASGHKRREVASIDPNSALGYDLFTDPARSSRWEWRMAGKKVMTGTLNFGGGSSASVSLPFYSRLVAGQTAATLGQYTDAVTVQAYVPSTAVAPAASTSLSLRATIAGSCSITSGPGTIALSYTAFSDAPANASTSVDVTCVRGVPYTVTLDSYDGVASGLPYSLALSAPSGIGSGAPQAISITGAIPAGQAGTCASTACVGSRTHVVTIVY